MPSIAIMQPYFFPYIGYYSLIKQTESWMIFDPVQFIRHGWIERNRILKPHLGWQYIQVPLVKHSRETLIKDISIRNEENWKEKIIAQLQHYKKVAPFYHKTVEVVKSAMDLQTDSIVELNAHVLKVTCNYLEIDFNYQIFSSLNLELEPVNAPDEWALNICKALKVNLYINPTGGIDFFSRQKYLNANIGLKFLKPNLKIYNQKRSTFEAGLSIIDVMMFNSPEEIREMLDDYEYI